jgi:hypothetical protein
VVLEQPRGVVSKATIPWRLRQVRREGHDRGAAAPFAEAVRGLLSLVCSFPVPPYWWQCAIWFHSPLIRAFFRNRGTDCDSDPLLQESQIEKETLNCGIGQLIAEDNLAGEIAEDDKNEAGDK